ncbi:hypothetical protein CUN38_05165 [Enterococcus faecium]|uniref:hypothetical protein n=1 Tax=Enterococcus faecium TaxID=1352 RepID=UPI000CF15F61|nr:hypothetical protein [Enterococcus faecium]PQC93531.1 hypothetical protein CUN38_05165 [Enterococcus faecium]
MFTVYFEFRKNCLKGFEELEMESAMNALNVIKENVNADICFDIQYGTGFVKAIVLLRAVDVVEFILARDGIGLNMAGRGFTEKVLGVEIHTEDETITEEVLLQGKLEEKALTKAKFPRVKHLINMLRKKG